MRCTLASLAVLALAVAPAMSAVVDEDKTITIIGDGKKTFNKTLHKLKLPDSKDWKKPLTDDLNHLSDRIIKKGEEQRIKNDDQWSKDFIRLIKATEPLTKMQEALKNKTLDKLTAFNTWKEDARAEIQAKIDKKQEAAAKHEQAWETLKFALNNYTDNIKTNVETIKGDMTFLMEKTSDANAEDKAEIIDAATGGKVTLVEKRVSQEDAADAAKFVKKPLVEVTGDKTVTFQF